MKFPLVFILLICSLSGFSQNDFKPGYFIDENGQKHQVLIKDEDWRNNPLKFNYKSVESAPEQTASLKTVKEFSINNGAHYIRATVNIDQSSNETNTLSRNLTPEYLEETVFLKLLAAGEANLFHHQGKSLKNFFYSKNNGPIEPLVYKKYIIQPLDFGSQSIKENNYYQQQLETSLSCDGKISRPRTISYSVNDLVRYFNEYNTCAGSIKSLGDTGRRTSFQLGIRPGVKKSGMEISSTTGQTNFEDKYNFRFGIEGELILPFNNNKWAIIVEPTYQSYQAEGLYRDLAVEVDYTSIELPMGLRHYFYLNSQSGFFINAAVIWDFPMQGSIVKMEVLSDMPIENISANMALGAGYNWKKLSVEARYHTPRNVLVNLSRSSSYETIALILGYRVF